MKPHCRLAVLALVCMPAFAAAAQEAQPRVFFAPAERQQITAQRNLRDHRDTTAAATAAIAIAPPADINATPAPRAMLRLDGITVSQHGQPAAWISGKRYENGASLNGHRLRITRDGIELLEGRNTHLVRVGQTIPAVRSPPPSP